MSPAPFSRLWGDASVQGDAVGLSSGARWPWPALPALSASSRWQEAPCGRGTRGTRVLRAGKAECEPLCDLGHASGLISSPG